MASPTAHRLRYEDTSITVGIELLTVPGGTRFYLEMSVSEVWAGTLGERKINQA